MDDRQTAVELAVDALSEALGHPVGVEVGWKAFQGSYPIGVISRRMRTLLEDALRRQPSEPRVTIPSNVLESSALGVWVQDLGAVRKPKPPVVEPTGHVIVPQANSYERLVQVMEGLRVGLDLEAALNITSRTLAYYRELAEFLGWLHRERGAGTLTESGIHWLALEDDARHAAYHEALWATPLMRDVRQATDQGLTLAEAVVASIARTGLSEATVERRKNAVLSLVGAGETGDTLPETTDDAAGEESTDEGLADSVFILQPPSLLLRTLERLEVTTVGDLLKFRDVELRTLPGVGRLKAAQLRLLIEAAQRHAFGTDQPISGSNVDSQEDQSRWALVSKDDAVSKTLVRLSNKATKALENSGIETLAQLDAALPLLDTLHAVGRKTVAHIREHFERLLEVGPEVYAFGDEGVPSSVEELLQRALSELDERTRECVIRHELGDETLEEIAGDFGLTRERIRQVIANAWEGLVPVYQEVATELLAPEFAKLERPGLLMVCRTIDEAKRLDLAMQLTGYNPPRHKRVLSKNERSQFDAQIQALRSALEDTGQTSMELEDALDVAENVGIMVETEELMRLFEDHWRVSFHEGRVVFPWYNIGDVLAEELQKLGKPADATALQEAYNRRRAESGWNELPELNDHSMRAHLARTGSVWNYRHGVYVHIDVLPFDESEIERVCELALERLRRESDAVGANTILEELAAEPENRIPEGFTPHLLKNAIYRHPQGLTFKNNLLIARADSFTEDGVSMKDRLIAFLDDATEPLNWRVVARAMKPFGYASTSVYQTLTSDPDFVGMGKGSYVNLAFLGFGPSTRDVIIETTYQALPADGAMVRTADVFASFNPQMRATVLDETTLERLARLDARIDTAHGMMARASGTNLLQQAVLEALRELGAAYPRDVRTYLAEENGFRGPDVTVSATLARLLDQGQAVKLPGALYSLKGANEQARWRLWEKRREMVVSSASHGDADTHDPEIYWSLICYIERLVDDDPLAARLIRQFLKRTDLPAKIRQDASDLQFALSMGMG